VFFRRGLAYRQLEPVWGGTADTAVDVRASCAMGLVASGYSRALVELTSLLNDPEPGARLGAVRAIACGNPREAELLLRSKALSGDAEPQVLGECLTGLLTVEPEESLEFVAAYLEHDDEAVRELAALALGESRLDAALAPLKAAWSGVLLGEEFRRALLRAVAAHRSEAAAAWLLDLVAEVRPPIAVEIVEALALYKNNAKLMQRLRATVTERADASLLERLGALER
jgi:HEAT repeat protein